MTDQQDAQLAAEIPEVESSPTEGGEWFRSPLVLLAGLILVAGALALIVVSLTGGDDDSDVAAVESGAEAGSGAAPGDAVADAADITFGGPNVAEVAAVTLIGEPLPQMVPGGDDTALGLTAPEAQVASLANGAAITLGPGRARVIGFFAHWCPHCQEELPLVAQWLADNELPPNVEFVAVSTSVSADAGNYPPSAWFNEVGWTSPVVVDDAEGSLLRGYGFGGFPAFIAIDAGGTVVGRSAGNIGIAGIEELFANFAS